MPRNQVTKIPERHFWVSSGIQIYPCLFWNGHRLD